MRWGTGSGPWKFGARWSDSPRGRACRGQRGATPPPRSLLQLPAWSWTCPHAHHHPHNASFAQGYPHPLGIPWAALPTSPSQQDADSRCTESLEAGWPPGSTPTHAGRTWAPLWGPGVPAPARGPRLLCRLCCHSLPATAPQLPNPLTCLQASPLCARDPCHKLCRSPLRCWASPSQPPARRPLPPGCGHGAVTQGTEPLSLVGFLGPGSTFVLMWWLQDTEPRLEAWNFRPHPPLLGGGRLETEFMMHRDCAYVMKPPSKPTNYQVQRASGSVGTAPAPGAEAPVPQTPPDLALCASSSDCLYLSTSSFPVCM